MAVYRIETSYRQLFSLQVAILFRAYGVFPGTAAYCTIGSRLWKKSIKTVPIPQPSNARLKPIAS